MSRLPPTLVQNGSPLSLQCSDIQPYFGTNQCVTCPANIDGTKYFCFNHPGGSTFGIPYQAVAARVNPTAQAREDVGTPSFSLTSPYDPCDSTYPSYCPKDPLCTSDDGCTDPKTCCQCCALPIAVLAQGYATAADITATCTGSLTGPNNNILCYPCAAGYVPIVRAKCTDDCDINTYYSCMPGSISIIVSSTVQPDNNGVGMSPIPFVFWNIYNANGAWSQGGTIHTLGYRSFPDDNGNGTLTPGQTLKLYGVGWVWAPGNDVTGPALQSYQTCTMVYTFENFSETIAAISFIGSAAASDNTIAGVACPGSLNFQCAQLATPGAWDMSTCEHVPACCSGGCGPF